MFKIEIFCWSNTLKQFVGNLPTNCLSVFDQLYFRNTFLDFYVIKEKVLKSNL